MTALETVLAPDLAPSVRLREEYRNVRTDFADFPVGTSMYAMSAPLFEGYLALGFRKHADEVAQGSAFVRIPEDMQDPLTIGLVVDDPLLLLRGVALSQLRASTALPRRFKSIELLIDPVETRFIGRGFNGFREDLPAIRGDDRRSYAGNFIFYSLLRNHMVYKFFNAGTRRGEHIGEDGVVSVLEKGSHQPNLLIPQRQRR